MKVVFTVPELEYLNQKFQMLSQIINQPNVDPLLTKMVHKVRHKFSNPQATFINLKPRERDFLLQFLNYRHNELIKVNSLSVELEQLQQMLDKVDQ